jgi:hypothetical protein
MDNLLVGNLFSPVDPLRETVCRVMSSVALSLWKTFRDHRDHHSEDRHQTDHDQIGIHDHLQPGTLITITPES